MIYKFPLITNSNHGSSVASYHLQYRNTIENKSTIATGG